MAGAILNLTGMVIILLFPTFATAALAIPVLAAFSIIGIYSAWQLLRTDKPEPRYVMRSGTAYPVALAVLGVIGLTYSVIASLNTSSPTIIGIYLIVLATGLRGLYEKETPVSG
jgi:hypothetical protein